MAHRRLLANPSYYDLEGTDSDSLDSFLSVLVEDTLADLEVGFCDLMKLLTLCVHANVCLWPIHSAAVLTPAACKCTFHTCAGRTDRSTLMLFLHAAAQGAGCVEMGEEGEVSPTPAGRIASIYYLQVLHE